MITTADALDVLTVVTACHRRTAPRMDDEQATLATAAIWAELFNTHHLELPDLVAAVKMRAQYDPAAPEPAEIITFARKIRKDRRDKEGPSAAYEAMCESKSEDAAELATLRVQRSLAAPSQRPELTSAIDTLVASATMPEQDQP